MGVFDLFKRVGVALQAVTVPGTRYQEVRKEADLQNWSPIQWKLVWLADGFVLGRRGIRPRFRTTEADEAWEMYSVDPAGHYTPLEFERVVSASLVAEGESFIRIMEAGKYMPVPAPYEIRYDSETHLPTEYVWNLPTPQTIPANEIIHLFLRVRPGQRRGDNLFKVVEDIATERLNYIRAIAKLGKMAARLWIFHKRRGGSEITSAETTAESPEVQTAKAKIDFDKDGITTIGPNDEVVAPGVSSPPVAPSEMDKALGITMAMPFGISSLQLMGDFSATNYSSGILAYLTDQGTWRRYQGLILKLMRKVYSEWPDRALYQEEFIQWHLPPFPSIDPIRTANTNKIMIADKTKAPQEAILEDDRDPEVTFRLIEEFLARFGTAGSSSGSPGSGDGDPDDSDDQENDKDDNSQNGNRRNRAGKA